MHLKRQLLRLYTNHSVWKASVNIRNFFAFVIEVAPDQTRRLHISSRCRVLSLTQGDVLHAMKP